MHKNVKEFWTFHLSLLRDRWKLIFPVKRQIFHSVDFRLFSWTSGSLLSVGLALRCLPFRECSPTFSNDRGEMYSTLKWSDNFRVVNKAGDFPQLLGAWPPTTFVFKLNQKSNKKYFIKKESIGKSRNKLSNIITAHLWNTQKLSINPN